LHTGEQAHTVAKKIFPSSLPTPSRTFSSPESVTCDMGFPELVRLLEKEKYISSSIPSSSSREGKAQSMSSMRNIACFGMAETARSRKESSTLNREGHECRRKGIIWRRMTESLTI